MGWTNSHLHCFETGLGNYAIPFPGWHDEGVKDLDSRTTRLHQVAAAENAKFRYEYDFGDGWEHELKVIAIMPETGDSQRPGCLSGEQACPPEDCGGIYGYYDLLAILADRKHKQHEDLMEWIGGKWDAAAFDFRATDAALGSWWNQRERKRAPAKK